MIADPDNPGNWLRRFKLSEPVVSCSSAAAAKGVALHRELKTLIVVTEDRYALAHLRGDRRLSLRAVKRCLSSEQGRLADPADLVGLGVGPGTISPFHPELWRLTHVVSRDVLELSWVTTNASLLDEYIVFDPLLLLRARDTLVTDLVQRPAH